EGVVLQLRGGWRTGEAVRDSTRPVIVSCTAVHEKVEHPGGDQMLTVTTRGQGGGHYVTVAKRNKKRVGCDTFCVLDSASGAVYDVAIDNHGLGVFSFIDHNNVKWVLSLEPRALKFVKG